MGEEEKRDELARRMSEVAKRAKSLGDASRAVAREAEFVSDLAALMQELVLCFPTGSGAALQLDQQLEAWGVLDERLKAAEGHLAHLTTFGSGVGIAVNTTVTSCFGDGSLPGWEGRNALPPPSRVPRPVYSQPFPARLKLRPRKSLSSDLA